MSTNLYYNNQQILSGQPTPFVGKQESYITYGERWGNKTTLSLVGQITGCTYPTLLAAQNQLIQAFTKDFQTFSIIEEGNTIFSKPYTFVRGINFESSSYNNVLPYTVTLELYDQQLFSGVYGVLDPVDEWDFEETTDGLINVRHNISARGFNTTSGASNALQNAKDFVLARTGINTNLRPYFITLLDDGGAGAFSPCLKSVAEKPDRFNATYGVTETYVADNYFGVDGVLRYTVDFNCDEIGIARVTVNGTIDGCGMAADVTSIRNRYATIDTYELALDVYEQATSSTNLNSGFITNGFTEDPYARKLTFNVTYDNTSGNPVYVDYSVNLESGEDGITTVSFDGTIKGRGDLLTRWTNVRAYYDTFNPFPFAGAAYSGFAGTAWPLHPAQKTKSVIFNQFNGEISTNYSWDNRDISWSGLREQVYTYTYSPSIQKIVSVPLLHEAPCALDYFLGDAGYANRGTFTFEGNGKLDCAGTLGQSALRAYQSINFYAAQNFYQTMAGVPGFADPLVEKKSITTGAFDVRWQFQWSFDSLPLVIE